MKKILDSTKNILFKNNKEKENSNIVFDDEIIRNRISSWIGMAYSSETYEPDVVSYVSYSSIRKPLDKEYFKNVERALSDILAPMGVDKSKTCHVSPYKDKEMTFECHIDEDNRDFIMHLSYQIDSDSWVVTIRDESSVKVYAIDSSLVNNSRTYFLKLYSQEIINSNNRNHLFQYATKYKYSALLSREDLIVKVDLKLPRYDEYGYESDMTIAHVEDVQDYLLDLAVTEDLNLKTMFEMITGLATSNDASYNLVDISIAKRGEKKDKEVLQQITVKNGEIVTLKINRNGKKVGFSEDSWEYKTKNVKVVRVDDTFGIKFNGILPEDQEYYLDGANLATQLQVAKQEVERVRKLAKELSDHK